MFNFLNDVHFSLKLLRKNSLFSFTCLLVITVGLTVSLCILSILDFYERPLVPEGDELLSINAEDLANRFTPTGYTYNMIKANTVSFEELAAYRLALVTLTDADVSQAFMLSEVSPNLMSMTGVAPYMGRHFVSSDALPANPPVVMISYDLWQNYYASNPDIIGTLTRINDDPVTIVGVMPANFSFPMFQKIWRPLFISPSAPLDDKNNYSLTGRLSENSTFESAANDINQTLETLRSDNPDLYQQQKLTVGPYNLTAIMGGSNVLSIFFSPVVIVIFSLASLNLSTLLFTRANERQRELAVRSALGANTWQLRKQVLIESALLCVIGGILAVAFSELLLHLLNLATQNFAADAGFSFVIDYRLHQSTLVFAIFITASIWLLSASVAAYRVTSQDISVTLETGSRGATSHSKAIMTRMIISVEVIFSCFLMVICGLLITSMMSAQQTDRGFRMDNLILGDISFTSKEYQSMPRRTHFLEALKLELQQNSNIQSVGFTNALPPVMSDFRAIRNYAIDGIVLRDDESYPNAAFGSVTPNYFSMLEVEILEGRAFTAGDTNQSTPVVIIDEHDARSLWPTESAVGKRVQVDPNKNGEWLTVVGVNAHIDTRPGIQVFEASSFYRPLSQLVPANISVVIETVRGGSSQSLARQVGRAAARVDRNISVDNLTTMEEYRQKSLGIVNFISRVFTSFALFSLVLAVVGIYGIVSRSVSLRFNEMGIRRALGSSESGIIGIFLRQGISYLLLGITIGGSAAIMVSVGMANLIPQILDEMPVVMTLVIVALGVLILLASYIPARKVVIMEPGDALRYE